uniref:Bm1675 n=2 Tax=Brugia TaxID=6278 RepID=A0A1I9GD17_BRUMA|nr:Bm1675 [Brugia malayi]
MYPLSRVSLAENPISEQSLNRRKLVVRHEEPQYSQLNCQGARPFTLFKSVYTNNTDRSQEYSFKTERTTESLCSVVREQGYMIGGETELTLKTPCLFAFFLLLLYFYYNFKLMKS